VTAPATEVAGIYGFPTNAMPPQGDYFMASTLAVPNFTHWMGYKHNPQRESNRYGLYPTNELAGISPDFVLNCRTPCALLLSYNIKSKFKIYSDFIYNQNLFNHISSYICINAARQDKWIQMNLN
jgi:hypothetical protein